MPRVSVLVEMPFVQKDAFTAYLAMLEAPAESFRCVADLVREFDLGKLGLDVAEDFPPVPMFAEKTTERFHAFAAPTTNPDETAESVVVACEVDAATLASLRERAGIKVYANSPITLFPGPEDEEEMELFDLARSGGGLDCRPFRPAVTVRTIRRLLGVRAIWADGFRGQNVVVGIIDEGVDGTVYPVVGGFSRPNARRPGTAAITSHGSMCAADVLVAAPAAKLYDYPFLGIPNSGGALQMFHAVLEQRRLDGTPHLTTNSYGFVGVPPRETNPTHEVWDPNHPLHRKVREVVVSGAPTFFAAGNCGSHCPSAVCHPSGIGPGRSIHASNSLTEVITVAAVNSRHERIGYSSQGPGMFEQRKPDLAAYSHFFGNFGPGRPAGGDASRFDSGTSAATPVAAGVAALLLSAVPGLNPAELREAMTLGAMDLGKQGWDTETGHGVINAAASYMYLRRKR